MAKANKMIGRREKLHNRPEPKEPMGVRSMFITSFSKAHRAMKGKNHAN